MSKIIACKLPAGFRALDVELGLDLKLRGAHAGEDLENPSRNGSLNDLKFRQGGFGLTEVSDEDAAKYAKWVDAVTYKEGTKSKGKLAHPFLPIETGALLGPFKDIADARTECKAVADGVTTGFEGVDVTKIKDLEELKEK